MAWDAIVEFPVMKVGVRARHDCITEICYLPPSVPAQAPTHALAERAARQLERYRADPDTAFDLPVRIAGSELQRRVWDAMCAIPRGRTRTYGDVAKELGSEARVVGQACGDNRLPLVIPCHRIVAADGLGGFGHATSGFLIEAKRWLLAHEARPEEFALRP
ncbi:MAG TPA: methylated-DNA--[protein]-cysteine S-methyltransferase [Burkholderiales bacterium]|nr:methylated-DNA--[protein]-cysteine S-methyltransferase [Burkholderiales bacterium]